jgi:hypothetical protein
MDGADNGARARARQSLQQSYAPQSSHAVQACKRSSSEHFQKMIISIDAKFTQMYKRKYKHAQLKIQFENGQRYLLVLKSTGFARVDSLCNESVKKIIQVASLHHRRH